MSPLNADRTYDPLFGDPTVTDAMSDRALVQAMFDVESALAEVEAELGVIPAFVAAPIREAADVARFDLATLARETAVAGNLAIPLVRQLTRETATIDARAAGYVHWGATSQDVLDTALVLQLRTAVPAIVAQVERAIAAARRHAAQHRDSVMPGRTLLQQATPITFGLKAAGWLDALHRQRAAVAAALDEASVLQFGGASGTLASLGDAGPGVIERLAARLGLKRADMPWHAHRDRLARLGCGLGVLCGTCGKIARDVSLLSQTEVREAAESRADGGGSSTMPHKRNPVSSSAALAAAVRAPGLVATMLAAMPQEHERGLGGWHAEWTTMPELVRVTAGAVRATADAIEGISVDPVRMRANVDITRGLVMAEAVMMALATHVGRQEAHERIEAAARVAMQQDIPLEQALSADPLVTAHLSAGEIRAHLAPERYLGSARHFIDAVLKATQGARP